MTIPHLIRLVISFLYKGIQEHFGLPNGTLVPNEDSCIFQVLQSINDYFLGYVELASIPTMINPFMSFVQDYRKLRSECYDGFQFAYCKPQSVYDIVKLINSFYDTLCNLGLVHLISNDVLPSSFKTNCKHTFNLDKAMLIDAMYAPHEGKCNLKRPNYPSESVSIADHIVIFFDNHFSVIDFLDHTKYNEKTFTENLEYVSAVGILTSIVRYSTCSAKSTAKEQRFIFGKNIINSLRDDYLTMFIGNNIFTFIRIGCILGKAGIFLKKPFYTDQLVDSSTQITRNHTLYLVRDTVDLTISSRCSLPRSQSCQCDQVYDIRPKRRYSDSSSPSQSVASGSSKKKSFHNKKKKRHVDKNVTNAKNKP